MRCRWALSASRSIVRVCEIEREKDREWEKQNRKYKWTESKESKKIVRGKNRHAIVQRHVKVDLFRSFKYILCIIIFVLRTSKMFEFVWFSDFKRSSHLCLLPNPLWNWLKCVIGQFFTLIKMSGKSVCRWIANSVNLTLSNYLICYSIWARILEYNLIIAWIFFIIFKFPFRFVFLVSKWISLKSKFSSFKLDCNKCTRFSSAQKCYDYSDHNSL